MTPKQKAAELILRYMAIVVKQDVAKKCALAAVDEIINIWEYSDTQEKWWWQQVKQEIENL
jgi:hypothetical protein